MINSEVIFNKWDALLKADVARWSKLDSKYYICLVENKETKNWLIDCAGKDCAGKDHARKVGVRQVGEVLSEDSLVLELSLDDFFAVMDQERSFSELVGLDRVRIKGSLKLAFRFNKLLDALVPGQ